MVWKILWAFVLFGFQPGQRRGISILVHSRYCIEAKHRFEKSVRDQMSWIPTHLCALPWHAAGRMTDYRKLWIVRRIIWWQGDCRRIWWHDRPSAADARPRLRPRTPTPRHHKAGHRPIFSDAVSRNKECHFSLQSKDTEQIGVLTGATSFYGRPSWRMMALHAGHRSLP